MTNRTSAALKADARALLPGKYAFLALVTLIVAILNLLLNSILNSVFTSGGGFSLILYLACSLLTSILFTILTAGQKWIFLKTARGEQARFSDLVFAFSNHPEALAPYAVIQFILQTILYNGGLWMLMNTLSGIAPEPQYLAAAILFAAVYVWVDLGLALVLLLYDDDPWKSGRELLAESWRLMRGRRVRLFLLNLSFIGLILLCVLTAGVGLLYVDPYMAVSQALFYEDARQEQNTFENSQEI